MDHQQTESTSAEDRFQSGQLRPPIRDLRHPVGRRRDGGDRRKLRRQEEPEAADP